MGSVNKVLLIGNLGRDAELRQTQSGVSVATLNLATTETWTDKQGDKQERTEWSRVVVWGKTADALQPYLVKGKQIYVEGKLQTRQWEKDGQKHYTTEVKADRIVLLGGGSGGRRNDDESESGEDRRTGRRADPVDDSDIPFAWLMPVLVPALSTIGALLA